jgi:hypothetical protein
MAFSRDRTLCREPAALDRDVASTEPPYSTLFRPVTRVLPCRYQAVILECVQGTFEAREHTIRKPPV